MRKITILLLLLWGVGQAQNAATMDPGFIPTTIWSQYEKRVHDMALQPDGKIIIVTSKDTPGSAWVRTIERLNPDGSSDPEFSIYTSNNFNHFISPIAVLPDGKILIGTEIEVGNQLKSMVRLNGDGTIDNTFNLPVSLDSYYINCITPLSNGKILIGNSSPNKLLRLNANGSIDNSFIQNPEIEECFAVLVLPDGKLIVAGRTFIQDIGGEDFESSYNLLKLSANGTIDTTFDIDLGFIGQNGYTCSLALQPDGKILVGGRFDTFDEYNANGIVRLHPNGSYDDTFTSPIYGFYPYVHSIIVQPNGNILIGGNFYFNQRSGVAVLLPDGSPSNSFYDTGGAESGINFSGSSGPVRRVLQQPDGMILHCGEYGYIGAGDFNKSSMVRLLGTDSYLMNGFTRIDTQNNGCSPTDAGFPYLKYKLVNGATESFYYSSPEGQHGVMLKNGTSVITPILDNPSWFSVSPSSITLTMPSATNYYNQNYCVTAVGVHQDFEATLVPIDNAVPGFDAFYKITVKNKGNQIATGSVQFTFDATRTEFVESTPTVTTNGQGTLTWNIENMQPLTELEYLIKLELNTPMDTPSLNGDDILAFTALATVEQDEVTANNEAVLNQTVVNSYDPNDKICLGGDYIIPENVGNYMYYRIRFENLGTAPARNIRVTDVIDAAKFDIASLSPVDGSHPFTTRIIQENQVEFMFNNIQLGFADDNNDGYLVFKIRSKATLTEGAVLENTAAIYFDYNFPIITNTAVVTVQTPLKVKDHTSALFTVYPVPAKDMLYISNPNHTAIASIAVHNLLGQTVISNTIPDTDGRINIATLATGSYIMQITTNSDVQVTKFIKE
ncbi:putative delta-60 repeat protein [Flavobacterium arsenatis]|uniref:Delta-60 repeat protein n=1 Tax=Flavobacterium arsenatis TaxID=1484332 RepID=A0ABU1TPC6_9FLAO|nr:T9SS type A sorting domain-containing protein [Flavobacterium arsenatis]MDR6967252.1 putative delta-60 repeat protein [Flavobacterium arsenatis]